MGFQAGVVIRRDGTVYGVFSTPEGAALRACSRDGTMLWEVRVGDGVDSAPVLSNTGVLYLHASTAAWAITTEGEVLWSVPLNEGPTPGIAYAPTLGVDGTIYLPRMSSESVVALRTDGSMKWEYAVEGFVSICAVRDDGAVLVGTTQGLLALDWSGQLLWEAARFELPWATPAIAEDGTAYVVGIDALLAIAPDGTTRWKAPLTGMAMWAPALGPDLIYVPSVSDHVPLLSAFSLAGERIWEVNTGDFWVGAEVSVDGAGNAHLPMREGEDIVLAAFSPDGERLWSYSCQGCTGVPAIATGMIVLAGTPAAILE